MIYYLAVDGGGTKTKVLCAGENGEVVGEGLSGPTSLAVSNVGAASFSLREAIRQATLNLPPGFRVKKLVMGLAGVDTPGETEKAEQAFKPVFDDFGVESHELMNDVMIALRTATDSNDAVALISGTGSNCFGLNSQGQTAKTGGLDFLLTDQGSGYEIGMHVLKVAAKSYDGRIAKSILEQMVNSYFQVASVPEMKDHIYNPILSKMQIAALATLAFDAAEAGDSAAQAIIDQAIVDLCLMAEVVIKDLALTDKPADLVLAGKIMHQAYINQRVAQKLLALSPQLNVLLPDKEPVYGALKIAMR